MSRRALTLALLAALPACRSGRPSGGTAGPGGPAADPLKRYVGQGRVLAGRGDTVKLALKKSDAGRAGGGCDLAVQVRSASFDHGTAQFALDALGSPRVAGRAAPPRCKQAASQRSLRVTGFEAGASADELARTLDQVLLTPEAYLGARGGRFDLPAGNDPDVAAYDGPGSTDVERRLARAITTAVRPLLLVDALSHDTTGRVRQESEVEFEVVVGADGRPRRGRVKTPLGDVHESLVLRVLPLWRFEPARQGDERVATRYAGRLVLRIF
jgi:hypothetical protein